VVLWQGGLKDMTGPIGLGFELCLFDVGGYVYRYALTILFVLTATSCDKSSDVLVTNGASSEIATDELPEGLAVPADVDTSGSPLEGQPLETSESKGGLSEKPQSINLSSHEEKPKPIDVSVVFEEDMGSGETYDFSRKDRLPDLFNQRVKEDGVTFSGKLINDPENPDYFDSVEGAEFSIEIKTR